MLAVSGAPRTVYVDAMNLRVLFSSLVLLLGLAAAPVASADVPPPEDSSTESDDTGSSGRGCSLSPVDAGSAAPLAILGCALLVRSVRTRARRPRTR